MADFWFARQQAEIDVRVRPGGVLTPAKQFKQLARSMLYTFKALMDDQVSIESAAVSLASTALESSKNLEAVPELWRLVFSAVQDIPDDSHLFKLAQLVSALSKLPDVINRSSTSIEIDYGYEKDTISPGQQLIYHKQRFWADLPYFGINLHENMQGPEAFLYPHNEGRIVATQKWKNLNSFCAYFFLSGPLVSFSTIQYAHFTMKKTLEYSLGSEVALHLPAASQWILIAGSEIYKTVGASIAIGRGDLWQGGVELSEERWLFWAERFKELAELDGLDQTTVVAAKLSAELICKCVE